jgi:hypothetical protein
MAEYFASLKPITMKPSSGALFFMIREGAYCFEVERYKMNIQADEDWKKLVEETHALYWCYMEDFDNLVVRNTQVTHNEQTQLKQLHKRLEKKGFYDVNS